MSNRPPRNFDDSEMNNLPPYVQGFLDGLCAASNAIWPEGGLVFMDASETGNGWEPGFSSSREDLQRFFACVLGNREETLGFDAAEVLDRFSTVLANAFPAARIHLQVDENDSWSCTLHVLVLEGPLRKGYRKLYWSVD